MTVKKRRKSLSHGRPPISKERERMSSKQSRTIIRTHHRLQKEYAAATKDGDLRKASEISEKIDQNGGLKFYQAASKQGQSKDRGGDSSKVLVAWLHPLTVAPASTPASQSNGPPLRVLEIGALSTGNCISKYPGTFEVTRIDLNSQGLGIQKQDFMKRPLPESKDERFDIISLSLVLNYVPEPTQRGLMLKRIPQFLAPISESSLFLPALFLVLPLPCVTNSRYLDEELLLQIMDSFGFALTNTKKTAKLCYYLFRLTRRTKGTRFEKRSIHGGPNMNNFCIVVE